MTGGKKKRRDLQKGQDQFNQFANKTIALQEPFAKAGVPAVNQLSAFAGLGTPEQSAAANDQFENSLFFTGGEKAFGLEKDNIDSALSNSGLLFSQARLNAVEDARQRNFQSAFGQFLNSTGTIANVGIGAATNQGNAFLEQGLAAQNTQQNIASTRQGFLGGLKQATQIGKNVAGSLASGGF